jgi:hypothetical protein
MILLKAVYGVITTFILFELFADALDALQELCTRYPI